LSLQKIHAKQLHNGYQFLPDYSVLIIHNNKVEAIVPLDAAGDDVLYVDGIVCPGFVNAHCHLELSYLYQQIPQQSGMVNFLLDVMQKRNTANELLTEAIEKAEQQMIENGIVAVGDICNTTNTIFQKTKNNLYYKNFIEISGFVPQTATQRMEQGVVLANRFLQQQLNVTIVPHAPYSVSADLMQHIYNYNSANISLHYLESDAELLFLQNATGDFQNLFNSLQVNIDFYSGFQTVEKYNLSLPKFENPMFVHNVNLDQHIIHTLKTKFTNPHFCICPNANLYIGNALPPLQLMIDNNVNICIGTDSLASNTALDIKAEIKTIQQHNPNIAIETIIQWATSNGAKALGIENQFGSFEIGKCGKYVVL
jgi:aminodeoxyfutalosine deaminase